MITPLVSVIIPTRNRKELLKKAVKSVLSQTYKNIQVIIHDNNSKDGTNEFIANILLDKRAEYHKTDHDLSMTDNWNTAFKYVRGEYFIRLDDDNVFSSDFIEKALQVIEHNNFDLFTFSSLIVHLENSIYTLFNNKEEVFVLDQIQLAYLEYFALTDTNYSVYKTSVVKNLFPDGNIYATTLPDRNINYKIAQDMLKMHLRAGVSPKVMAVTRLDHRSRTPKNFKLTYLDYNSLRSEMSAEKDCHDNFSMHRINLLSKFLSESQDRNIQHFFNTHVTHPKMLTTLMMMGHLCMAQSVYSLKELTVCIKYIFKIFFSLIAHPGMKVDGSGTIWSLASLSRNSFKYLIQSVKNILLKRTRTEDEINLKFGNEIIEKLSKGSNIMEAYNTKSVNGDLGRFLDKIKKLEISVKSPA